MGGIECQGHIAGPGQMPGVKRGTLFLHAAAGMGDHHRRIFGVRIKTIGQEQQARQIEIELFERNFFPFFVMRRVLHILFPCPALSRFMIRRDDPQGGVLRAMVRQA